ncbi:MAG: CopG family transcriptional regulator [Bacillota bacterium]
MPEELEKKLVFYAARNRVTKKEIVKRALENYFSLHENQAGPYELGQDLFGKYGSGNGSLSTNYKQLVREKIHEKMSD